MTAINPYYTRQLTRKEIAAGEHRNFVGGLWREIGALQLEFLRSHGLQPNHKVVDIGCGALRCGIPIIRYLEAGNYFGFDINASLIEAGRYELDLAGLSAKRPNLLVNDKFELERLGESFDFALAQSLFTHLNGDLIVHCLVELRKVLRANGKFFATFFLAPWPGHVAPIHHEPGGVVTHLESDPFHYSFSEMQTLAEIADFSVELIGDWNHPRNQQMLRLYAANPD